MTPPPAARHRTASEQVGSALLDAAQAVLDREGLSAVSVRAVASEAGVAPMGVYNRFQNKDGLLIALATRAFGALKDAVGTGDPVEDPLGRFREGCRAYRTFALRYPQQYRLMFTGVESLASPSPAAEHGSATLQVLVDTIDVAVQQGILRTEPVQAAQVVWNAIHGAVSLELANLHVTLKRHGFDPAETYDRMLEVLIDGLR
ncbi:TetR/AcrR family transcriptional regulator [Umezawaea endophytica]|uniref:TetR/AcrR family transcriptional regulator n=1 Tax=Umezawaea endophytica TaxID=1654476 RepID=A0A9X2VPV1_9PSEU|nr:TetR/AcrR family transcriptional regulator [Umezawaea endophytica]MCS7480394.1 TetR/AcrR family transcriptional regulator [Umezawaea endophytica]